MKLLDFGIARLDAPGATDRTRTGIVMGTPAYMAPEQARGMRVDHRCDVYAVGAIVYRCLTGRPVYDDEDPAATLTSVLTREPPRPRAVTPDIPEEVEVVIERAIAREPAERFQSMAELDAALAGLVHTQTLDLALPMGASMSRSSSASVLVAKEVQRARPTIALLTIVGVLLGVGMIADLLARILARTSETGLPTGKEGMLVVVGVVAGLATPVGLWVRFLATRVWRNSLRAVALARRARATVGAAAATYAFVLLVGRILDLAFSAEPRTSPGLFAAIMATSAAVLVALVTILRPWPWRREARD